MLQLNLDKCKPLRGAVRWFNDTYLPNKYQIVSDRLPTVFKVATLHRVFSETQELGLLFTTHPANRVFEIRDELIPVLKRALIAYRRYEAGQADSLRALTNNAEVIQRLEDRVTPLDNLLREPWFDLDAISMPRTMELLSVQALEDSPHGTSPSVREYDEKFHILQAPKLFLSDLGDYRRQCEERGVPVIAAYLDIDDFKARFNSPYGETQVDRRVLPIFMQALEAHVFQHGFAYRQGGDEYLILLPNLTRDLAINLLDALRLKLSKLEYHDIQEKTTVSIGFCCVDPDSHLTDREIEQRANNAKDFAKKSGKNCIATYTGSRFDEGELRVVSPAEKSLAAI